MAAHLRSCLVGFIAGHGPVVVEVEPPEHRFGQLLRLLAAHVLLRRAAPWGLRLRAGLGRRDGRAGRDREEKLVHAEILPPLSGDPLTAPR